MNKQFRLRPFLPGLAMILPPFSMDLGLLLISIGVVNLWRARDSA
jgi:hypothetical protein